MVLTALADARLVRDLMGRGVMDVVQKPVQYDMLAMKVAMMADKSERQAAEAKVAKPKKKMATKVNLLHQIETSLAEMTDLFGDRLDSVFDWPDELPDPPRAVRDCIRRLAESEVSDSLRATLDSDHMGNSGRKTDRVTCCTDAVAVPVDKHWQPTCMPFKLALRDLSESGARLLYTRATTAKYLALKWNATQLVAKQIRVVLEVTRVKPISPFYDIGGRFIMAD